MIDDPNRPAAQVPGAVADWKTVEKAGDAGQPTKEELAAAIVATSADAFVVLDEAGIVRFASPGVRRFPGVPDDLVGQSAFDIVDPAWVDELALDLAAALSGNVSGGRVAATELHLASGMRVPAELLIHRPKDPRFGALFVHIHNVPGARPMDEFLEAMVGASDLDDLLRPVMELAIADAPAQGCTIHWGWSDEQGFAHHTGLGVHPALRRSQGITTDELPWCGAARRSETVVLPVLGDGDAFASEASCRGFGAVWSFPIPGDLDDRIVLSVWRGREGAPSSSNRLSVNRVLHMAALAFQRHRTEEQLRHAALHDPLTGAPNRTVLDTHLESVLAEPDGTDALFVLDLDGFKQINDEHGHPTGDLVLRAVVDRIDHALRPGDLLARLGGDEFAVVCQAISDADEAAAIAQRLLAAISEPLAVDGRNVQVGASVGISLTGPDQTPNQLLRSADQALIAAKRQGKGTLVFASTT